MLVKHLNPLNTLTCYTVQWDSFKSYSCIPAGMAVSHSAVLWDWVGGLYLVIHLHNIDVSSKFTLIFAAVAHSQVMKMHLA